MATMNLSGLTPAQRQEYEATCAGRRAEYRARLDGFTISDGLKGWAADMTARFGPLVQVWNHRLDWITALAVVRYGEAVDHWPSDFSEDDERRAWKWLKEGTPPEGVAYLEG